MSQEAFAAKVMEIELRVQGLERTRRTICDEETILEGRIQAVDNMITGMLALFCSLLVGVLALGRGVFHALRWKLYVFFFAMLLVVGIGFSVAMHAAKKKLEAFRWVKDKINKDREKLQKEVQLVTPLPDLAINQPFEGIELQNRINAFTDIRSRLQLLLSSLEGKFSAHDKRYLIIATTIFISIVIICLGWVIFIDLIPGSTPSPSPRS